MFVIEQSRDSVCAENFSCNHYLSPVSKLKNEIIIEDNKNSSLNTIYNNKDLKEDDGYSTMQQENQNYRINLFNKQYSIFQPNNSQVIYYLSNLN